MRARKDFHFGGFRLDAQNEGLWHGEEAIKLTPKALAVLHHLVMQAGQLVSKEELWREVWGGIAVTDAALTMCLSELRKALGDHVKTPQFIATVHRRGYRFIAPLSSPSPQVSGNGGRGAATPCPLTPDPCPPIPFVVGRETELARLHEWLAKALNGERQLVFVTGEPGIGKTAIANAFLANVAAEDVWVARGYCVEAYGAGEAYLPVLTALDDLCRTAAREEVVALLRQHAPLWLEQLPSVLSSEDRTEFQRQLTGVTPQRMLREMGNFLGALTATRPLVLVLEDLHWSDPSTVALLTYVARWADPLRLLVIGTYRPSELLVQDHPLATVQAELQGQGVSRELPLPLLTAAAVTEYVAQRTPQDEGLRSLAQHVYQRTEGNPLFMVAVVDELLTQGTGNLQNGNGHSSLDSAALLGSIPERLRQLVNVQMTRLAKGEQRVLEAASVAGETFAAAEVAAALGKEDVTIEGRCAGLARRQQFLRQAGVSEWPDGTVTGRYGFAHAVYQSLWQERVTAGRWKQYHFRIGERKERSYGERAREIATELALHFEQGREYHKAIHYLQQAAQAALLRSTNGEAVQLLTKGLELLDTLSDTPERSQREISLRMALGTALMASKGYSATIVEEAYTRAWELCQQLGVTPRFFPILQGLCGFYTIRGELQTARDFGEQSLRLAQNMKGPAYLMWAHFALGTTLYYLGEFTLAQAHLEKSATLHNPAQYRSHHSVQDPGVANPSIAAWVLWSLGYPDQALQKSHEGLSFAQRLSHPFSLAFALSAATRVYQFCREIRTVQNLAQSLVALSIERGFEFALAQGNVLQGWVQTEEGSGEAGTALIHQGVAAYQTTGAGVERSHWLALQAEAYGEVGKTKEGLKVLATALTEVQQNGIRYYEAELYRLKGELTLRAGEKVKRRKGRGVSLPEPHAHSLNRESEAEACFLKAIEVAQKQHAKSWELRATTSLARLWQQQGKQTEAHQRLSAIYHWFTEGFDTKDLQEAKALLEELEQGEIEPVGD
ncbi:MAG: AAA family ATPase [Candidatus Binatia bacterium]